MSNLQGKKILVAGGTGDVGAGIVGVLLSQGAEVIVPARSEAKAERLRAEVGPGLLTFISGDVGTVAGAQAIAAQIGGPLDGVVASLGGWWQGRALPHVNAADWDAIIAGNLTSHFAVASAFVPMLESSGGSFIQILGAAADYPVPGSSLVSITAAAVSMMGRMMAAELGGSPVHIHQVMIASIVATRARAVVDPSWVTAADVGAVVANILREPEQAAAVTRIEPRTL
jgi:NAD(P)-dependent dehydrogenase (short-subunit alcohol dehydrogenase family)